MSKTGLGISAALALATLPAPATATVIVVDFDDLVGDDLVVPDGYGGINWSSNWLHYGSAQDPYNPASPPQRIYRNYLLWSSTDFESVPFYFPSDVAFLGAAIAGFPISPVTFDLYRNGVLVHSSGPFVPSDVPTFHASGYAGRVDEVRFSSLPFIVFDDITYQSIIPEPATWAMLIAGFGLVGAAVRRRSAAAA